MEHTNEDKIINFIISLLKFGEFSSVNPLDIRLEFEIENSAELSRIFKIAESEGLIEKRSRTYIGLTKKGFDIQKSGGWIKHLESIESEKQKMLDKDNLDLEIKVLQKDNFEYQHTIREQNDRIRNLTEELQFVNLIKQYRWLIGACIGLGWFLGEILEKI
ncbi:MULTISPECIES: hypothetical protein [Bizionia]|uniref:Uncharacterized protein n=1 Tax=Bizionia algoritergicola TaxID=291187 RepID=A0A5D0QTG9_9FLAO|nr:MULTISPECIES: hypothetical protein [Bizionia]OBX22052.1 hypothetical protein BAA08_10260 [Bizionia sp. APA-3]TYB72011.1 hypothetical protein ES675_12660 [Bizionia algoritergicola]